MWSLDIYGKKKKVLIGGEETPAGELGVPAQFANAGLALYQVGPDFSSPNAQQILKFQEGLMDDNPTSAAVGLQDSTGNDGSSGASPSGRSDRSAPSGASAPIASFGPVASSEPIQEENLLRGRGLDPSILSEFPGGTTNLLKGPGLDASILDQLNDDRLASSIPAPQPSPGAGYYNAPMVRTLGDRVGGGDGGELKLPSGQANASKVVFPIPSGAPQQATPGKLLSDSSLRNDLAREQQRADVEQAASDLQEALAATAASNDRPIRSTPNYFQDTPPIALSMAPAAVPPVSPRPTPQDSLGISPSDPRKEAFRERIPFYEPNRFDWTLLPTYSYTQRENQVVASGEAAVLGYYNLAATAVNAAAFWLYATAKGNDELIDKVESTAGLTPGSLLIGTPGLQTLGVLPEISENLGAGLSVLLLDIAGTEHVEDITGTAKMGSAWWRARDVRSDASVVSQQYAWYCSPASGEMLAESVGARDASGVALEQSAIAVKANTSMATGTLDADLAEALNDMNKSQPGVTFEGYSKVQKTPATVRQFVANGDPFMAGFKTSNLGAHAVVVDGITKDGLVMIRDPEWANTGEGARYEMTMSDFLRVWDGSGVLVQR